MQNYSLVDSGKNIHNVKLPSCPRRGDVISLAEPKSHVYLVLRVEYVVNSEIVNLHVKTFVNQLSAINEIEGFRNRR